MKMQYEHKIIVINSYTETSEISKMRNDGWKIKGMTIKVGIATDKYHIILERITRENLEQQKKEFAEHFKKVAWEHHCIG